MKKLKIFIPIALLLLLITGARTFAQTKTDTIKVWGNCEMCEKRIEKAAKKAGADKASWDPDTQILVVSYNTTGTTNDAIQKKIASVGYDTEKYTGDDKAYSKLDKCCQYERKNAAKN